MANEISVGISIACLNGTFNPGAIQRSVQTDQAATGEAALQTSVAAIGSSVLHGNVAKPSAVCATTTTLPACTYNNGASGVGATLTGNSNGAFAAVDGVTLVVNQRILVKNQASGLQNGLYVLTTVGDGSNPYVLTRHTAMDTTGEFVGAGIYVESGTVNAGLSYTCTNASAPTLGSTSITFSQSAVPTAISTGNVSTFGIMFFENLDSTNYVTVGTVSAGVLVPFGKIAAGKFGMMPMSPGISIGAVASAGTVKLFSQLLEA